MFVTGLIAIEEGTAPTLNVFTLPDSRFAAVTVPSPLFTMYTTSVVGMTAIAVRAFSRREGRCTAVCPDDGDIVALLIRYIHVVVGRIDSDRHGGRTYVDSRCRTGGPIHDRNRIVVLVGDVDLVGHRVDREGHWRTSNRNC